MGIKRSYFSETAKAETVGDSFIDRMCSAFGFHYPDQTPSGDQRTPSQPQLDRLQRAIEEQGTLLRTLTELVISRLPKP